MAMSFHLEIHWSDQDLHLDLKGEFNESAARQLLYFMRHYCMEAKSVFIHTETLTMIKPLGLNLLCYGIGDLGDQLERFVFTGDKARQLVCAFNNQLTTYDDSPVAGYATQDRI